MANQYIWQPRSGRRKMTSQKMTSFRTFRRLKHAVSQIKREKKVEKSTTHHSQQCNLLNNQQLYQPRTCPLNLSALIFISNCCPFNKSILHSILSINRWPANKPRFPPGHQTGNYYTLLCCTIFRQLKMRQHGKNSCQNGA